MTELVVIRAESDRALVGEMTRLIEFLDRVPDVALVDVAYTCSLSQGQSVIAIIAEDVPSLRARLFSARSRLENGGVRRLRDKSGTYYFRDHLLGEGKGKLAFLFPGVMSFYPDMMRDMAIVYPECRSAFDELEEALVEESGEFVPSSFVFPPAPYYRHDADIFSSGAYAQALVSTYSACAALVRLLRSCGVSPDGVVGFAGGDLAALMRTGNNNLVDFLESQDCEVCLPGLMGYIEYCCANWAMDTEFYGMNPKLGKLAAAALKVMNGIGEQMSKALKEYGFYAPGAFYDLMKKTTCLFLDNKVSINKPCAECLCKKHSKSTFATPGHAYKYNIFRILFYFFCYCIYYFGIGF